MSKLLSALLMAALVAGVTTVAGTSPAQDKKDTKKDGKTDPKTTAKAAGGTVKIAEGKDGKFRFSVYDAEGNFQAMSGANTFETKEAAAKGVDALRAALAGAKIEYAKGDKK